MNLNDCYNFSDFRKLAKRKLPSPIFHYIDGGADDETTLKRNYPHPFFIILMVVQMMKSP